MVLSSAATERYQDKPNDNYKLLSNYPRSTTSIAKFRFKNLTIVAPSACLSFSPTA